MPSMMTMKSSNSKRGRRAWFFVTFYLFHTQECVARLLNWNGRVLGTESDATIFFRVHDRRPKRSKKGSSNNKEIRSEDDSNGSKLQPVMPPRPAPVAADTFSLSADDESNISPPTQRPSIPLGSTVSNPSLKRPASSQKQPSNPTPTRLPTVDQQKPQRPAAPAIQPPFVQPVTSRAAMIRADLAEVTADGILLDETSSQAQAMSWLINSDPAQVEPSTYANFRQRYSLATLYFATSGDGWISNSKWLRDARECSWDFISCDQDDAVAQILLGKSMSMTFAVKGQK